MIQFQYEKHSFIKTIEIGKSYLIHDGSKAYHHSFVMQKDDKANRYLVVITESDKVEFVSRQTPVKALSLIK